MEMKRSNARVKSCSHQRQPTRAKGEEQSILGKITAMYPLQIMSTLKNSDLLYLFQSLN